MALLLDLALQFPVKEVQHGRPQMHRPVLAADAVALAGIGHHFELVAAFLHLVIEAHGIGEDDIVVGHAVDQEKRGFIVFEVREDRTLAIAFEIRVRVIHVAFGIGRVVERPVGDRSAGHAGGIGAGACSVVISVM